MNKVRITRDISRSSRVNKKSKHAKMPAAVMSEEAREVMKGRLGPEYEVYHYVKERLSRQYKQCQTKNKQ